jgi:phage shock protein A
MFKALKRWWKYLTAKTNKTFDEKADPAVQLEQAITEAQEQHRRLREQAANVIANEKQLELRLNRSLEEYERLQSNTRQAVLMADEATRRGDAAKAVEYTQAAESFANRLIVLEREIEESKTMALAAAQAAEQAKAAVNQNAATLQRKLAERQQLLSQLDQAKMQEQLNTAMAALSETVGQDTPSFEQVREKIETRYARAKSMTELSGSTVEARMLEVEQATVNVEAQARLAEIRTQLGLAPTEEAAPTSAAASTSPATAATGIEAEIEQAAAKARLDQVKAEMGIAAPAAEAAPATEPAGATTDEASPSADA